MPIRFSGLDDAKRAVEVLIQERRRGVEVAMGSWGLRLVDDMRADHPYQDRTGQLTGSIATKLVPFGSSGSAQIWLTVGMLYAEYVEYGTVHARPYPYFWPKVYQQLPALEAGIAHAQDAAIERASR